MAGDSDLPKKRGNRNMTTTREAAVQIRADLKKRGWTSRDVSVRTSQFAGGSSIDVEIIGGS
jgi:superfamily II DNA/RNA helicase